MHCIKRLSKQSTRNTVQMGKTGVTSRWKKIEEGNEIQIGEEKSLTWKSINATCLFFWESVMWRLSPLLIKHINMLYYYVININSGDVWHLLVSTQKVVCNSLATPKWQFQSRTLKFCFWSSAVPRRAQRQSAVRHVLRRVREEETGSYSRSSSFLLCCHSAVASAPKNV